jgi:hypothetical protein
MRSIERLKHFKHNKTYLEIVEDYNKIIILIRQKKNREVRLKLEVGSDDEETLEKICGVLKYYEFSEHRDINSMYELKKFIEKNRYYIGYNQGECVFITNYYNGMISRYKKPEIESMHKVNINAI